MSGLEAYTLCIILCGKMSLCRIGSARQGLMLPMLNISRDWIKFNRYIDNWLGAFLAPNHGLCTNINCTIVAFQFHCNISVPLTWLAYGHHRLWTVAWRQSDTRPLLVLYTDGLVQDRSISIANTLEIPQSCIKSPGYISLHMSFIYYTHCHVNSIQMVNFMGIHKVIINIDSGRVPVRHQATVHTPYQWASARKQHPCHKCPGDTAVQQQTIWIYELVYDTHMSHMLTFQSYTYRQFYVYAIRSS